MNLLRAGSCGAAADGSVSPFAGVGVGRREFTRESSFIFEASLGHWPWAETCYVKFGPGAAGSMTKRLDGWCRPTGPGPACRGLVSNVPLSNKARLRIAFFDTAEAPINWLIAKSLRQVCHEKLQK